MSALRDAIAAIPLARGAYRGLRNCATRSGVPRLWRAITGRRHVILTFHRLHGDDCEPDAFDTCPSHSVSAFREIIQCLKEGFPVVSLRELVRLPESAAPAAAITFDDGWRDTHDLAFPVLRKLKLPATVFVVTGKIGSSQPFWPQSLGSLFRRAVEADYCPAASGLRRCLGIASDAALTPELYRKTVAQWKRLPVSALEELADRMFVSGSDPQKPPRRFLSEAEIRAMASHGVDFGSHTVHHKILTRCELAVMRCELSESKSHLERLLGREVELVAYPNGDYSADVVKTAGNLGYRIGCTCRSVRVSPRDSWLCLPRIEPARDGGPFNIRISLR